MSQSLFLVACAVLFVVPLVFVAHRVYRDGVLGRLALLCIAFAAFMFLAEAIAGQPFYVPPLVVLLVVSFAVFMVWHLFRFHCRVLKQRGEVHPFKGGSHA